MKQEAYKNQFVKSGRAERFKQLLEGQLSAQQNELEISIADMEDSKFKVGEQYELYNKRTDYASSFTVDEVLDEMIKVKFHYPQSDSYGN